MDRVYISRLKVEAVIGIHDWERKIRQPLYLDLEVATDAARVAAADDIAMAVDYSALAERLEQFIRDGRFRLLETLAEAAAAMIIAEFGVAWLRLRVGKPGAVAAADSVGVEIERQRPV
jgi:dihydroneopterin aldolase